MIIAFSIITIIIFIILILFSFPRFSPIPYFPTNKKDLPLIIKALTLNNNQTIIDLGAGDGVVIFEAARQSFKNKLNTQFVAVEINPVLILILHLRRLFHLNKKNIKILWADLFKTNLINFMNLKNFITVYLYVSPWLIEKIVKKVRKQIPDCHFVSYFYPIKSMQKTEKKIRGINNIYTYK